MTFGKRVKPDEKKAIIITGATSGIGLALSKYFYKLGFSIIACYYNSKESGYEELDNLSTKDKTKRLFLVKLDVRSEKSIENAKEEIDRILMEHGIKLYCLLNNAGLSSDGPFQVTDMDSMRTVLETNYIGTMMVSRKFVHDIIKNKGRIVNVSSIINYFPVTTFSIYGSTKAAVAFFSDSLDQDMKAFGASCCCVFPGNYVANTNIVFTRLRCLNKSLASLTEEEKNLYADMIKSYSESINRVVRAVFRETGADPAKISEIYNVNIEPEMISKEKVNSISAERKKISLLNKILKFLTGGTRGRSLDETGLIEAYDDAVRLLKPYGRNHAGSYGYRNFFGPLLDYLSYTELQSIVKLVHGSKVLKANN